MPTKINQTDLNAIVSGDPAKAENVANALTALDDAFGDFSIEKTDTTADIHMQVISDGASHASRLIMSRSRKTGTVPAVQSGDTVGRILFEGRTDKSGDPDYVTASYILFKATGNFVHDTVEAEQVTPGAIDFAISHRDGGPPVRQMSLVDVDDPTIKYELRPFNGTRLGNGSRRWEDVYSQNDINIPSDERLKRNINTIPPQVAYNIMQAIRGVSYQRRDRVIEEEKRVEEEQVPVRVLQDVFEDIYNEATNRYERRRVQRLRPVMDPVYDHETGQRIPGATTPRMERVTREIIEVEGRTIQSDQIHTGVIAQEVIAAFAAEGLDAIAYDVITGSEETDYGMRYSALWALQLQADRYRDQQMQQMADDVTELKRVVASLS